MIIGVSSCVELLDAPHHSVFDKYLDYVTQGLRATPLMIPCLGLRDSNFDSRKKRYSQMVERLDGVLLTGSPSNVEPKHYGADNLVLDDLGNVDFSKIDRDRDATTLPLILACIEQRVPLLGICRGMQEINVALGGSLYQALPTFEQRERHRAHPTGVFEEKYNDAHSVTFREGGQLKRAAESQGIMDKVFSVNSLHRQAVEELGQGLVIEAISDDGIIEAISLPSTEGRVFGVQWHPEWNYDSNIANSIILGEFQRQCTVRFNSTSEHLAAAG